MQITKFLEKINIKLDENQKWIALSTFVLGLVMTYINPTIVKAIITALPAQWVAIESLVMSVSTLLVGMVWQGKLRKKAMNGFIVLVAAESIGAFLLGMYLTFISWNVWVFAIASLIYSSLISVLVGKCLMAFRTKLWKDKDREIYDNNCSIIAGITCIMGFSAALLFLPSLKTSIFLWGCCCLIDNIAWGYVYWKNRLMLRENEASNQE